MPVTMVDRPMPTSSGWGSALGVLGNAVNTLGQAYGAYKAQQPQAQPAQFQQQAPGTGFSTTPQATLGNPAFSQVAVPAVNAGEFQVPQLQLTPKLTPFATQFLPQVNPYASVISRFAPWPPR